MAYYKVQEVIEAIEGSQGLITQVAKRLNCSRVTVYNYINRHKKVKQALIDEREKLKDFAESKLVQQIQEGNMTAIIFYLKTQAKDRGYIERQDVNVQVENELNKAMDLLEKKLSSEEYQHVIGILAGAKSSATEIKIIPASAG
jgi:transposase